jgi:hypothetical protein
MSCSLVTKSVEFLHPPLVHHRWAILALASATAPGALLAANIAEDHCPVIIHAGINGLGRVMSALPPKADIG